jgi:hypothetical protein
MNWNAIPATKHVKNAADFVSNAAREFRLKTQKPETQKQIHVERLLVAMGGFAHFELLYSACKLDLFGYLEMKEEASLKTISRELGIPEYSLRVLLMGCRFLGLIEKYGNSYSNTPLAEGLSKNHPKSVWPTLNAYHSIIYPAMHKLSASLESGTNAGLSEFQGSGNTLYERLEKEPELERIFHDWMKGLGRTVGLTESVLELLRPSLDQVKHLVDYGGGDGSNAISICEYFPHLKVTIFDSASVCQLARKKIEKARMSERIFLKEGDFLNDPFIEKVDGIMFNHIFNIYSEKTNASLLLKSHNSLSSGGVTVVFNSVASDSEDGPAFAPVLSAYFLGLATGQGMVYPLKDYDKWFNSAGFSNITKIHIPEIHHGLVIAKK